MTDKEIERIEAAWAPVAALGEGPWFASAIDDASDSASGCIEIRYDTGIALDACAEAFASAPMHIAQLLADVKRRRAETAEQPDDDWSPDLTMAVGQRFAWLTPLEARTVARQHLDGGDEFVEASVYLLQLSGTGLEEPLLCALLDYMRSIEQPGPARLGLPDHPPEAQAQMALCAELAICCGLIEYGTSLRYSWPTERGLVWLADAVAWEANLSGGGAKP